MKKVFMVAMYVVMILSLVACGVTQNDTSIADKEIEGTNLTEQSDISFEKIDKEAAPTEVQEKVDQVLKEFSTNVITIGEDHYILITMGEQATGGYEVMIHQVVEVEEEVRVWYEFISPGNDDMTTQALTYPYSIVKIPHTKKTIVFEQVEKVKQD
jgi:hypothetical protein